MTLIDNTSLILERRLLIIQKNIKSYKKNMLKLIKLKQNDG